MVNKKEKSKNALQTIEQQEPALDNLIKNYSQTVEHGKQIGKESIAKINEIIHNPKTFSKPQE